LQILEVCSSVRRRETIVGWSSGGAGMKYPHCVQTVLLVDEKRREDVPWKSHRRQVCSRSVSWNLASSCEPKH